MKEEDNMLTDEEAEQVMKDFDKLRFYKDKNGKKKWFIKKEEQGKK